MQTGRQLIIIEHLLNTWGCTGHFISFYISSVHNMQSRYYYLQFTEEEANEEGSYDVLRATQSVRI